LSAMTNVQKGSYRVKGILDAITICKVIDTNQITELFFGFPTGLRKCQAVMKSLYDKKLVKKTRLSLDTATVYYQGKFPRNLEHSLGLTWAYVWLKNRPGETLLSWELEQLKEFGGILQCDALCSVRIEMTKEIRWYCVEMDRGSVNRSKFDKIDKYIALYNREGVQGSPLLKRLDNPSRFPKIIIVTDDIRRGQRIREMIANTNTRLKFEVHLLSALKERSDNLCRL
jgi:hypothetical protein